MRRVFLVIAALMFLVSAFASTAAATTTNRVVVVVMENKHYAKIQGNTVEAPYINSLANTWRLFTDYHAIANRSLNNYLAMTAGITAKPLKGQSVPNLFHDLDVAAVRWVSLEESMGANCGVYSGATVPGSTERIYTRGHDPAFQFRANDTCKVNDVPMTPGSFDPATLPQFTLLVPNQCNNMHTFPTGGDCPRYDGGLSHGATSIGVGDDWASFVIPQLLAQPDITVILTWDEGTDTTGQQIVTIEAGAGVVPGTDGSRYDHYGLEAALYGAYGLGTPPGAGASATVFPIP